MRKPAFCKTNGADQLCGHHVADQCLCFRYIYSTIPPLSKPLAIFCGFTARFVSDPVETPKTDFLITLSVS